MVGAGDAGRPKAGGAGVTGCVARFVGRLGSCDCSSSCAKCKRLESTSWKVSIPIEQDVPVQVAAECLLLTKSFVLVMQVKQQREESGQAVLPRLVSLLFHHLLRR